MDFEFIINTTIVIVLVITLVLIAILAIFTAIRNKSIGFGPFVFLALFMFLVTFIAIGGSLYWYARIVSSDTQVWMGLIAMLFGTGGLSLSTQQFNRMAKMGNMVPLGMAGSMTGWQIAAGIISMHCLLTMSSAFIFDTNMDDAIRQNTPWWLLAFLLFVISFFSFEFREKGMVYHGRIILFSDIEHAEWENLMYKTKLKIRLKGKKRELSIRTPWKSSTPIDKYIRANFPRP